MKPTQVKCSEGSINQLPPWTEIQGDIRLTPFYDVDECMEKVKGYVQELNNGLFFSIVEYYVKGTQVVIVVILYILQISVCCQLVDLVVSMS